MRTINLDDYRTSINYYGGAIRNSIVEYFISFLEQGEEITEEAAQIICDTISEKYGSCDVELQYGGQPIYYYVISVE